MTRIGAATGLIALTGLAVLACTAADPVRDESRATARAAGGVTAGDAAVDDAPVPRVIGAVTLNEDELAILLASALPATPPPNPTNRYADDPAAAEFGRRVFYDERFSARGDVSCATCHDPMLGFADGKRIAEGTALGTRHTPTLWNAGFGRWFFWDGRADSLWAQALSPLENEVENATTRLALVHRIAADPLFAREYERAFGPLPDVSDPARFPAAGRPVPADLEHPDHLVWAAMAPSDQDAVTQVFVNVGKALEAFQRRIVSNDAPFDRFRRGVEEGDVRQQRQMTAAARRGFQLFAGKARCHLCHHGPLFTDLEFHNTRVPGFEGTTSLDGGRFQGIDLLLDGEFLGTSRWSDDPGGLAEAKVSYLNRTGHSWGEFKTPSLRNVAATAPYMHNGRFATLEEVVTFYSTLEGAAPVHHRGEQLLEATNLAAGEIADLVAFLESLTDNDVPDELLAPAD
ncbi:MAG: cytochrome c peroxidase [Planctomycetota bacterium]